MDITVILIKLHRYIIYLYFYVQKIYLNLLSAKITTWKGERLYDLDDNFNWTFFDFWPSYIFVGRLFRCLWSIRPVSQRICIQICMCVVILGDVWTLLFLFAVHFIAVYALLDYQESAVWLVHPSLSSHYISAALLHGWSCCAVGLA